MCSDEKAAAPQSSVCLLVQQNGEVQWLLNKEAGLLTLRESLQGVSVCVGGDGGGSGSERWPFCIHHQHSEWKKALAFPWG